MSMEDRNKDPVLHGRVSLYRESTSNRFGIFFTTVDNLSRFSILS